MIQTVARHPKAYQCLDSMIRGSITKIPDKLVETGNGLSYTRMIAWHTTIKLMRIQFGKEAVDETLQDMGLDFLQPEDLVL
ncbi:MAG TPA: hypothetical protein VHD31_01940 [Candidatus Paceibacterota bacterium]|nr:hypothetical protein [Candidatus Paceibacterota bacterium]